MALGRTIRGYLSLCRISNLPSVWTNVLCAFVLATGEFRWAGYLPLALALSCFYLAGMCLNDICDAAHDRINRPKRPIPAGMVSLTGAWFLTVAFFVMAFSLLLIAPHCQGIAGAVFLVMTIVAYDLRHKKNPFSVLLMATCRLLIFVVTALAMTGQIARLVLVAGSIQFVYVVFISLVARHENNRSTSFPFPVIPLLLAGIPLLDGVLLATLVHPVWLLVGIGSTLLMHIGQRFVRGD